VGLAKLPRRVCAGISLRGQRPRHLPILTSGTVIPGKPVKTGDDDIEHDSRSEHAVENVFLIQDGWEDASAGSIT